MKFLVISGQHEVVVVRDEKQAQPGAHFDRVINVEERAGSGPSNVVSFPSGGGGVKNTDLNAQVEALEEKLITEAMATTGNNQVKAAQLLRITRGALQYKLKKYAAKGQHQQAA
ncbi:MAG: helix-turn-helix domain-containing protein [Deltaproteobacteria bacterium]|nr:helix-turn-helix domain-containing protein [Deltaproteobacteria bacterium]